jgi:hypothetical protein
MTTRQKTTTTHTPRWIESRRQGRCTAWTHEGTMGCGCVAHTGQIPEHIHYCPTHAHAPAMVEALRAYIDLHASDATEHGYATCDCVPCIQARAILRAVEG